MDNAERRLADLEHRVIGPDRNKCPQLPQLSLSDRIDELVLSCEEASRPPPGSTNDKSGAKRSALHDEFGRIGCLLKELDISATAGPTRATANSNSVAFRRLEILAQKESLKRDIELLAKIRDLASVGSKISGDYNSGTERVASCLIVSSERYNFPSDSQATERLQKLCLGVAKLNDRSVALSQRADSVLNLYASVARSLSEKIVLVEEQVVLPK
ncbi:hypothetical protein THAOC_01261 [Thalassiosira oceanica]|uniref:Uncharacterized protein n=1 Tax=Thalassiosira oceanica TaxID=159749 RepID=K0TR03_THAOC|nr:hypothetical protein THAOC_01261 [Thalassiosira oceanica]|eukprot:EJK76947.1 hypothetical protein THAOC_01261 [Thalassiosira oceanica]